MLGSMNTFWRAIWLLYIIAPASALVIILWLRPMISQMLAEDQYQRPHLIQKEDLTASNKPQPTLTALPSTPAFYDQRNIENSQKNLNQLPQGISYAERVEQAIFVEINKERKDSQLLPLSQDDFLRDAARLHSIDMIKRKFFDHINPDRKDSSYRIAMMHRRLIGLTGENIYQMMNSNLDPNVESDIQEIAKKVVKGWMNSDGHRANILRKSFTHMGLGVAIKHRDTMIDVSVTQNFSNQYARLKNDLATNIDKNDEGNFVLDNTENSEQLIAYDFWNPNSGVKASPRLALNETWQDNVTGVYQLRFYFEIKDEDSLDSNIINYTIYLGPIVILQ